MFYYYQNHKPVIVSLGQQRERRNFTLDYHSLLHKSLSFSHESISILILIQIEKENIRNKIENPNLLLEGEETLATAFLFLFLDS